MDASVKSELKALKRLLISSHDESKAYRQELQCVNKECLVMKHKIDVLLHALEEVSRWSDNSTISSLASLVASICTIGSDELNESPPKPSTMVFMADECKEGHGDQIPVDSQLALVQVRSAHSSRQINDGVDVMDQKNGVWISPHRKHMVAAMPHTDEAKMDIDTENRYAVLESLGKTRNRSADLSSPNNRKCNKHNLSQQSHMEQILANNPMPESPTSGSSSPIPKYSADGRRVGGSFISRMTDSATRPETGVTPQGTADPNVTRGQGGNLGDSNSDL